MSNNPPPTYGEDGMAWDAKTIAVTNWLKKVSLVPREELEIPEPAPTQTPEPEQEQEEPAPEPELAPEPEPESSPGPSWRKSPRRDKTKKRMPNFIKDADINLLVNGEIVKGDIILTCKVHKLSKGKERTPLGKCPIDQPVIISHPDRLQFQNLLADESLQRCLDAQEKYMRRELSFVGLKSDSVSLREYNYSVYPVFTFYKIPDPQIYCIRLDFALLSKINMLQMYVDEPLDGKENERIIQNFTGRWMMHSREMDSYIVQQVRLDQTVYKKWIPNPNEDAVSVLDYYEKVLGLKRNVVEPWQPILVCKRSPNVGASHLHVMQFSFPYGVSKGLGESYNFRRALKTAFILCKTNPEKLLTRFLNSLEEDPKFKEKMMAAELDIIPKEFLYL